MKRKSVSKRLRFEVFKRDGFTCQYCGQKPPVIILEVDHIVPVALGGDERDGNLITSCADCNRGKAAVSLGQVPQPLADQIDDRRVRAKQVAAYNRFLMSEREREDGFIYELGDRWFGFFYPKQRGKLQFSQHAVGSLRTFLRHLPPAEIMEATDIVFGRVDMFPNESAAWKYFCGVCWRKIKKDEPKK